jgi:hypothetical protein
MSDREVTRDEIIVMSDPAQQGVFRVAVVALNQKHRLTGDPKEWIGLSLPLDLANELAKSEGQKRSLPVTIWGHPS